MSKSTKSGSYKEKKVYSLEILHFINTKRKKHDSSKSKTGQKMVQNCSKRKCSNDIEKPEKKIRTEDVLVEKNICVPKQIENHCSETIIPIETSISEHTEVVEKEREENVNAMPNSDEVSMSQGKNCQASQEDIEMQQLFEEIERVKLQGLWPRYDKFVTLQKECCQINKTAPIYIVIPNRTSSPPYDAEDIEIQQILEKIENYKAKTFIPYVNTVNNKEDASNATGTSAQFSNEENIPMLCTKTENIKLVGSLPILDEWDIGSIMECQIENNESNASLLQFADVDIDIESFFKEHLSSFIKSSNVDIKSVELNQINKNEVIDNCAGKLEDSHTLQVANEKLYEDIQMDGSNETNGTI